MKEKSKIPLILGAVTLLLFAVRPYILELIEPSKSIGQVVGENAKDLMDALKGKDNTSSGASVKRKLWSSIITITAFVFFALSIVFSFISIQSEQKNLIGLGGVLLSIVGLGIYLSHLAISVVAFLIIALLAVIIFVLAGHYL